LIFGVVAVLSGSCGGGSWFDFDYGSLNVRVADSPVDDAMAVVIQFDAVDMRISGAGNPNYEYDRFNIDPVEQIDLLKLSGGKSEVLISQLTLLSSRWKWVRPVIRAGDQATDSWVDTATGRHALYLPPEYEAGLMIPESFVVPKNATLELMIDFDLRQSIIPPENPGDPYILDPVLRMVEADKAGHIEGTVAPSLASADGCRPVVYGFTGTAIAPDDIDRIAPEPITEGTVALDNGSGEFRWSLDWLPAGAYTVALTCQGDLDRPDRDDTPTVGFQVVKNATVVASESTHVDL